MNPYQVLQVPPTATREEIRAAYRGLVRRWHPDRFMEGPERDWATEKMANITAAYRRCISDDPNAIRTADEKAALEHVEVLIESGELSLARRELMSLTGRGAEWNYLLGTILLRSKECAKARIYLSIAAHQQPDNARYAQALREANSADHSGVLNLLKKHFSR